MQILAPGAAGGLESVVVALAGGLHEQGAAIAVVAILDPGAPEPAAVEALRRAGLQVLSVRPPRRGYLEERRLHRALFEEWRPDVVHTHGYRAAVLAGSAARALGVPTVTTVHGFTGGGWKNRIYERVQLHSLRRYDAVVAVAGPVRDRLIASGIAASRVVLMPNAWVPAAPLMVRGAARAALGLADSETVIGWVGRLSPEKGADVLLDAIPRLDRPNCLVAFVGDGRARAALADRAARLGIAARVRWLGLVPGAAQFYAAFDCFVLSSRTEGTPIALFEAMAAGVPVVATRVGGVPSVVTEEEAILVPSEDPGALAHGIRQVLADPAGASERAGRAGDRLLRDYTREPWLERHLDLYRTILAHRPGKAL